MNRKQKKAHNRWLREITKLARKDWVENIGPRFIHKYLIYVRLPNVLERAGSRGYNGYKYHKIIVKLEK
jgi:hypothetical protein